MCLFFYFLSCLPLQAGDNTPILVIFHTSDVHGEVFEKRDTEGQLTNMGYARLKGYVDQYTAPAKMLVDAGDILHGTLFASMSRGELMSRLLQVLDYDALAVGPGEFEYGLPRLMELYDTYHLNFIASNILEKEDGSPLFPPYLIRSYDNLKVGIFGLTTPQAALLAHPSKMDTVDFGTPESLLDTAREVVKRLKEEEKVDLVVAVTHLGTTEESRPQAQLVAEKVPGIDLIIDGYSHHLVGGLKVGDTLITSAGSGLENLGKVAVSRKNGELVLSVAILSAAELESYKPSPEINKALDHLSEVHEQEMNKIVATSAVSLEADSGPHQSTPFGRILAASMAKAAASEVAMINSGAIAASLPSGAITQGQLLGALPNNNCIFMVHLTGAEITSILKQSLLNTPDGYLQFYGLSATISEVDKIQPDGTTIRQAQIEAMDIDGRPLEFYTEYTVAINDYLYTGGDGYTIFSTRPMQEFIHLNQALINFLETTTPEKLKAISQDTVLSVIVEEPTASD